MLVSDSGGSSSSKRLERLDVLDGSLLSFLGVVHFRGLGVLRFRTKLLLTSLHLNKKNENFIDKLNCTLAEGSHEEG